MGCFSESTIKWFLINENNIIKIGTYRDTQYYRK